MTSDDGSIDCTSDESGAVSGRCDLTASDNVVLVLEPHPDPSCTFSGWRFGSSTDCLSCNNGDPDMGAIDQQGDKLVVRVDFSDGYRTDETVTAKRTRRQPSSKALGPRERRRLV